MVRTMNFKSKQNYLAWVRYGQASGVFKSTPGQVKIKIKGKAYTPKKANYRTQKV